MAIYLEIPHLEENFPFRTLLNDGDILTTPHWHKEIEIIYVKHGVIRMGIGEETFEVTEGEFILIVGGRVHYVLASPGSIRQVYQFDEKFFTDINQEKYELDSLRSLCWDYPAHSREWKTEVAESVKKLLDSIYKEDQQRSHAYVFALKGYLYLMVLELYRNREDHQSSPKQEYHIESNQTLERLDALFCYIEDHYMETIRLEDAAAHIGFSSYYFTKFFKKNIGKTFIQFLNEYRIERAKWILLNEDMSAEELAEHVGIGSTKTFYRLFKEIVKMTPRTYKMKYRANNDYPKDNI